MLLLLLGALLVSHPPGAVALPVTLPCPWAAARTSTVDDEVLVRLREAIRGTDSGLRSSALAALVAAPDSAATPLLLKEYQRCAAALRAARDDVRRLEMEVERKEHLLHQLEIRLERDGSLQPSVTGQRQALGGLRTDLEKAGRKIRREDPWRTELRNATASVFAGLSSSRVRGARRLLWEDARKAPVREQRRGAILLLGRVGGDGSAVELQKLLDDLAGEGARLARRLPKLEVEIHKMERRLQEEMLRLGGGQISLASQEQYERVRREAAGVRKEITALVGLCDACTDAAAEALALEDPSRFDRAVASLRRAANKAGDGARLRTFSILVRSRAPALRSTLASIVAGEKDPATRARLVDELAATGDASLAPLLLDRFQEDDQMHVRSRAVAGLDALRAREAVGPLVSGLALAEGRLRTDIREALVSLTGQKFHGSADPWVRWWQAESETFEVPEVAARRIVDAGAAGGEGMTFFGIRSESLAVLFVLDVSGSMNFSMVPRSNPTDDPARPFDRPKESEISRLRAATDNLVRAVRGLVDGSTFNIILYGSDVWTWQDRLVTMGEETRAEAVRSMEALKAAGGTNIYGALQMAFELAEVDGGDRWESPKIDTIYLLTDGRPSVGVTTRADEILAFVRERNAASGIVIHTVGLSGAQDPYLLRSLAEQNGGTYAAR